MADKPDLQQNVVDAIKKLILQNKTGTIALDGGDGDVYLLVKLSKGKGKIKFTTLKNKDLIVHGFGWPCGC